jgi:hypothetical protein
MSSLESLKLDQVWGFVNSADDDFERMSLSESLKLDQV